jgi:hypothetical protein
VLTTIFPVLPFEYCRILRRTREAANSQLDVAVLLFDSVPLPDHGPRLKMVSQVGVSYRETALGELAQM